MKSLLRLLAVATATALLAAAPALARTVRVAAGGSIAEALAAAEPGTVVEVEPGVYHEALVVDTPGIVLRGLVSGAERPVLDGRGELNDGVIASGAPFTMTGFAVRHYKGNGVSTQGVDGVYLSDLIIDDTGLYGVYPVQSRNVTITWCTLTGIKDAAIYVGESETALVAYNEVHGNVAGIEIENTDDAEVRDNLAWDNTAGILVFVLPGKVLKEARRNRVHRNWVVRNNRDNFGDPEAIVGQLPPGIGILVMAADQTVVENNQVKENRSMGIGLMRLAPEQAAKDPEQEPLPQDNRIGPNQLDRNGLSPAPSIVASYGAGGDFAWDGTGSGNCADLPDAAVRRGAPIARCPERTTATAPADAGHAPAAVHEPAVRRATAAPAAAVGEADAVVHIRGMRYQPAHLTVARGATVAWVNDDAVVHTVTSGTGTTPTSTPLASPFLPPGGVYRHAFADPGTFEYLCLPHMDQANMRGATVTVTE